jgi:hypothetical protein
MKGKPRKVLTLRVFVYVLLLGVAASGLVFSVLSRATVDPQILRGHDTPYTVETSGEFAGQVLNHFKLHIKNQEFHDIKIRYELVLSEEAIGKVTLISPMNPVVLKSGELQRAPFFVRAPKELMAGDGVLPIKIRFFSDEDPSIQIERELKVVGPAE